MKKVMMFAAMVICLSGASFAEDAAGVIKLLKAKEAKVQGEFKDMTLTMESTVTMDGMEMQNTTVMIVKGKKKRMEISMMGMKNIMINDGTDIWSMSAQTGKRKLNSESEAGEGPSPMGWSDSMKAEGAKVTEETVAGRKCFVFDGTDKRNNKGKWSIDKTSLALVKYEGSSNGKNMVLSNSDFKKVKADLEIPYKMDLSSDGKPMMSAVIKSVDVNKGVDDGLFNIDNVKPEDLGKMDMNKMMQMRPKKK